MEENNENMTFENSSLAENTAVTAAAVENTENLNALLLKMHRIRIFGKLFRKPGGKQMRSRKTIS